LCTEVFPDKKTIFIALITLKKNIAIAAFLVFFLAQFGRVINFCFCKAAVYQQTKSFVCDCEKMLYTAVKSDHSSKEETPQNISAPQQQEELFHFSFTPGFTVPANLCIAKWPKINSEALCHMFFPSIFHPPLQVS